MAEQTNSTPIAPSTFQRLFGRFAFFSLLSLIALSSIPYGSAQAWTDGFVTSLLFFFSILWFAEGLGSKNVIFQSAHKTLIPLLLLAAFTFIQQLPLKADGAISYDPFGTNIFLLKLLAFAFTLGALLRYTNSEKRVYALIVLILLVALLCAFFGLTRQALQRSEVGFVLPLLPRNSGYAQFINRNHFATFMLMALGLILGLLLGRGLKRERWVILVAVGVPIIIALIACASRSGVAAGLAMLAFVPLVMPSVRQGETRRGISRLSRFAGSWAGRLLLVAVLVAGGLFTVVLVGGEEIVGRFQATQNEAMGNATDETNAHRLGIWRSTWQLFKNHPVTGIGFGGFWIAVSTVHQGSGRLVPQQAHNDYLEILASGGILGALLCVAFVAVFVHFARRQLHQGNTFRRAVCAGALTGLFGVAMQSLVEFGLHITFNSLICIILIVLATVDIPALNHRRN
jgi:O-antigen ligase